MIELVWSFSHLSLVCVERQLIAQRVPNPRASCTNPGNLKRRAVSIFSSCSEARSLVLSKRHQFLFFGGITHLSCKSSRPASISAPTRVTRSKSCSRKLLHSCCCHKTKIVLSLHPFLNISFSIQLPDLFVWWQALPQEEPSCWVHPPIIS